MTNTQATGIGTLYVVATPIGNREDITVRALSVLKSVDLILAEDTRHSLQLLTALGIKNKLSSYHAHNETSKSEHIIEQLLSGKTMALISDAGTPLISDPGFPLVQLARQHHIPVIPIPGPSALITALSAAGLPCDSFVFIGFLPAKQSARRSKLTEMMNQLHTVVFYESTHRIVDCLEDIAFVYDADCSLVLAKELTKSYERFISGTALEIIDWLKQDAGHTKGEFVVIIPPQPLQNQTQSHEEILRVLLEELPLKQAVALACRLTKGNKNELYQLALVIKSSPSS